MAVSFRTYSAPARYGMALALVGVAMLVRHLLDPVFGARVPLLLQFLATLLAARYLGFGPSVAALFAFILPAVYRSLTITPSVPVDRLWFGVSAALAFSLFLIWLLDRQGGMRTEVQSSSRLAAERLEQLSIEVAQRERDQALAAQLKAVVESSEDAIISKDLDGIIRSWNHGAEQIFGYTPEEAVGKPMSMVVPKDRQQEESGILDRLSMGLPVQHFETVRQHRDGHLIPVSLTISPVRDGKGNVVGASHIARDITERNRFEEQIRQTQKLESLGVLAGGLAHDFNNLLTGVMGNASLVLDDLGPNHRDTARLQEILAASERAAVLVRQMLAYAGKGRFVIQRLDLSAQISEIAPLIRTSISPSARLELRLADNLPAIEADAAQIQQLIMNLATNAGEAIEGNGAVTITTSARQSDSELQVVLEVKDTGAGMDEQTRVRIFDPFFTTKFTGRGLGLAAVLGIIRSHNGTITVDTAPGAGSTFTVVLPATDARAPKRDAVVELGGFGHILVVDDEELVRNMARLSLERAGYTVETAADGVLAVEAIRARPAAFDAVLLDLTMPVMGGDEALRNIHAIRPELPVILSSGFSESEALQKFANLGLAGFLQKPYTANALARKLKEILANATPL